MNRCVIVDGNAVLHRAYHAIPPLTSPDGIPVNAVYGFAAMTIKIISDMAPAMMVIAFDRPEATFRNELFPEYQSQRPKAEADFIAQITLTHELVDALGIARIDYPGFEADDVIGTVCRHIHEGGMGNDVEIPTMDQTIIVTGDRDLMQLVNDRTFLYMPTKGITHARIVGPGEVVETFGVLPSAVVEYKALVGDASDNYPGVPGIGPKTAVQLIERFGTIERIYEALDKQHETISSLTHTVSEKLTNGRQSAVLSKTLATIRTDVPIPPISMSFAGIDSEHTVPFLERYGFRSLIARLGNRTVQPKTNQSAELMRDQSAPVQQIELF